MTDPPNIFTGILQVIISCILFAMQVMDLFLFFLCHREFSENDDQVQTCVEDYLQVLTSILSEKRYWFPCK